MVAIDHLCKQGDFIDGSAVCYRCEGNSYRKGLLFEDGNVFFPEKGSFEHFYDGLARMHNAGCAAYIKRDGTVLKFEKFTMGTRFSCGRAFIGNDSMIALIDTEGSIIKRFIEPFSPAPFHNGLARVFKYSDDGQFRTEALIDRDGTFTIPFFNRQQVTQPHRTDSNDFYSDGLLRIKINNKYAFIDRNINMQIPYIYDWASAFQCGAAAVRIENKYGFINKKNNYVLPSFFDDAREISECMAPVKLGNRWGMITMSGEFILDCDYEDIGLHQRGQIPCKLNGKWGLMNAQGHVIYEPEFDDMFYIIDGIALVRQNNKPTVLTHNVNHSYKKNAAAG